MSYSRKKTLGRYGQPLSAPSITSFTFPASVGGINAVDSLMLMKPEDCIYTYNLMPSEYGSRLRKGYKEWAINCVSDAANNNDVRTIISFDSNELFAENNKLFAVTSEGIWDVTLFGNTAPTLEQTFSINAGDAGYGVFCEFTGDAANSGQFARGHYLYYADALNGLFVYEEGGTWSVPQGWTYQTGVTNVPDPNTPVYSDFPVENIAYIMVYKQKIWVILENDEDAYYLPTASISGILVKFTFGSKLPHGGNLQALYNWTVDAGIGIDDMLVGVGRGGDVIVYNGLGPEDINFTSRGLWFIGETTKSRSVAVEYGPDLYLLSVYGIVSLNNLLKGDPADNTAISSKVSRFLREDVARGKNSSAWRLLTNPSDGFMQVITPKPSSTDYIQYNLNLQTGAWGFWEGVPVISAAPWQGDYFIGGEDGKVYIYDGTLDGSGLNLPNKFQDVPNPSPSAEWSVPVALEFKCDGTQTAETKYTTDLNFPTIAIDEKYILSYRVKGVPEGQDPIGEHWIATEDGNLSSPVSGNIAVLTTITASSAFLKLSLVGDVNFEGTFYDVSLVKSGEIGNSISFRALTSYQAPQGHSNFSRVGFIRTIGILAGIANIKVSAIYDYQTENIDPIVPTVRPDNTNLWDSVLWEQASWDYSVTGKTFLSGSLGIGRSFAVNIVGNSDTRLNIVGYDVLFNVGGYL